MVNVPVGGIHFVYNAICAITVGNLLGLSTKEIIKGIETFQLTKKRMEIIELNNGIKVINDSYNASFEAMQASLKYLSSLKNTRKIAVLGDMLELGEFSEELHRTVGKEVFKNKVDMLLCTGKYSKYIVESAIESGMSEQDVYYFENKESLSKCIKKIWKNGDTILLKASNGMKFYEILDELQK